MLFAGRFQRAALAPTIAGVVNPSIGALAEGLEAPVQLIYLSLLLAMLSTAAYVVIRQVLVQREMDERVKVLGELIRKGEAVSEDYFELGVVLARKRLYTQALKNYNKAIKLWDGDESELAQVRP
jgi:tetratricopeptide (TPR) repeat protein